MTKQQRRAKKNTARQFRDAARRVGKRLRVTDAKRATFRAERMYREPLLFPLPEAGWEGAQAYAKRNGLHLGTYGWWNTVNRAAGIGEPISQALSVVHWLVKRGYLRVNPAGIVVPAPQPSFRKVLCVR